MSRIADCFDALKSQNRPAFIPFIMLGDPSFEASFDLFSALPAAGADIIELGIPFSDPMADGPVIEAAGLRALKQGATLHKAIEAVRHFRENNATTPVVMMGYYNPFYHYGMAAFARDAAEAGVDGVILVDIPYEESGEVTDHLARNGIDFVRLVAPTTGDERLSRNLAQASGFVYSIAVKGITGAGSGTDDSMRASYTRLRQHSSLPIAFGFGIKTAEQAKAAGAIGDAVVVGSALVQCHEEKGLAAALELASELAEAIHSSRA